MPNDPKVAKSLFLQAMELTSEAERLVFLDRCCAGQPELRARIDSLLKTALDPDSLLDQPAGEIDATTIQSHEALSVALDFLKPSDQPGSLGRLGGYEILEVIGRGGMGIVLRAMDSKLHRVVAIKVLAPELGGNPQARRRFLREAQAAAAVCHDHVVTIHGVGDDEKLPFLVMECILGQSLQQKIDRVGALGLTEILRIGMQIAAGLSAAHKQGLVHRDIKPANILLENGVERVKITDFGLARATDDVGITQSGQIAGTPQYMSPEQAMGQPVDPRSDLFSLGSVLYTMCTGRPAFRADSTVAVLRRVCDDTPRPIGELNPEIPDWLIGIIGRLMDKHPQDRFQSAPEVAELLERWLAHCQHPASAPRPDLNVKPAHLNLDDPSPVFRKPASQRIDRRWVRFAGGAVFTAALLFTALYLLHSPFSSWCHNRAHMQLNSDTIIALTHNGVLLSPLSGSGGFNLEPGQLQFEIRTRSDQRIRGLRIEQRSGWPWKPVTVTRDDLGGASSIPIPSEHALRIHAGEFWSVTVEIETSRKSNRPSDSQGDSPTNADFNADGAQWTDLFNGRDLKGWKIFDAAPGEWSVKNGILTSHGPYSFLYSERGDYRDFHLRAEVKINNVGDSGIVFRSPFELMRYPTSFGVKGYEVQIAAGTKSALNTGALAVVRPNGNWELVVPMVEPVAKHDVWCTLQIVARGSRIAVKVDDLVTAVYTDKDDKLKSGHIALQQSTPQTIVQFRKIQIREFSEPPSQTAKAPIEQQPLPQQQEWAEKLRVPIETTNLVGMKLRLIPPGQFRMGSTPEELAQLQRELQSRGASEFDLFVAASSGPQHVVELTQPYYIGEFEVTVAQFRQFVEETNYAISAQTVGRQPRFTWKDFVPATGADTHPVCGVSWNDAKAFCSWLNTKFSATPGPYHYDLPTEAQWEYACRAGSASLWSFGNDPAQLSDWAIVGAHGQPLPSEIGQRRPNPFGLFDMHGNVDEWCLDWHNRSVYNRSNAKDPVEDANPTDAASGRVARGGAWNAAPWWSHSATRTFDSPVSPVFPKGFRVACKVRTGE